MGYPPEQWKMRNSTLWMKRTCQDWTLSIKKQMNRGIEVYPEEWDLQNIFSEGIGVSEGQPTYLWSYQLWYTGDGGWVESRLGCTGTLVFDIFFFKILRTKKSDTVCKTFLGEQMNKSKTSLFLILGACKIFISRYLWVCVLLLPRFILVL